MPTRTARTAWNGSLETGSGQVELSSSKVGTYDVSFPKRAADDAGGTTSPEELIAAAHSACYAMQLSALIAEAGGTPQSLEVTADVSLGPDKARRLQADRHHAQGRRRGRGPGRGRLRQGRRGRQGQLPRVARRSPASRSRWTPRSPRSTARAPRAGPAHGSRPDARPERAARRALGRARRMSSAPPRLRSPSASGAGRADGRRAAARRRACKDTAVARVGGELRDLAHVGGRGRRRGGRCRTAARTGARCCGTRPRTCWRRRCRSCSPAPGSASARPSRTASTTTSCPSGRSRPRT